MIITSLRNCDVVPKMLYNRYIEGKNLRLGAETSCPLSNQRHLVVIIIPSHMCYETNHNLRFLLACLHEHVISFGIAEGGRGV